MRDSTCRFGWQLKATTHRKKLTGYLSGDRKCDWALRAFAASREPTSELHEVMSAKNLAYLGFVRIAMEFSSRFCFVRLALSAITKSVALPEFPLPKIRPLLRQQKPSCWRSGMHGRDGHATGRPAGDLHRDGFSIPVTGREHDRKTDAT